MLKEVKWLQRLHIVKYLADEIKLVLDHEKNYSTWNVRLSLLCCISSGATAKGNKVCWWYGKF